MDDPNSCNLFYQTFGLVTPYSLRYLPPQELNRLISNNKSKMGYPALAMQII